MKVRYAIYCMLIALSALSTPISAEYDILGDVNADGRITTADSLLALRMAAGSIAPDLERANVDADGRVNSLDALMIFTMAQKTQVCVNSPEVVSGAFEVTIDIHNAVNLDSGQFDLSFDPGVVNVIGVHDGDVAGTEVQIGSWEFIDADTIRVLFNLPGLTGASGSGQIATIRFETTGTVGATSVLDISDGRLADRKSNEISALWSDCEVTLGAPVIVNAPEIISIVSGVFNATVEIKNVTDMNGGQFDISFNPGIVNVIGVTAGDIDGTTIPIVIWRFIDADTIRVVFRLSGAGAVSGSGYATKIDFEVTGSEGETCVLDISNGKLADIRAEEIPATWTGDEVVIGVPVIVIAPENVSGAFNAAIEIRNVTDIWGGQFDLSFDPSIVNVVGVDAGKIDGTTIPISGWRLMDADRIRVLFVLSGLEVVSGSGYLAKISWLSGILSCSEMALN